MYQDIKKLKAVQELDREIYLLSEEQERIPLEIKDAEDNVSMHTGRVNGAEESVKQVKLALNEKELELKENEALRQKYEAQLNVIKTNKEYSALQSEIRGLKADASAVEDAIIKLMDDVENAEKFLGMKKEALDAAKGEYDKKKQELEAKVEENKKRIAELNEARKGKIVDIDPKILAQYERIAKARDGLGISEIVNDSCYACRMSLRAQTVNEVMKAEDLVFCESCSRILYIDKAKVDKE